MEPEVDSLEKLIVHRLAEIMGIPTHSINSETPFTRLGVDSMVLTGFVAELQQTLNCKIDSQLVFENPSPKRLAAVLRQLAPDFEKRNVSAI